MMELVFLLITFLVLGCSILGFIGILTDDPATPYLLGFVSLCLLIFLTLEIIAFY